MQYRRTCKVIGYHLLYHTAAVRGSECANDRYLILDHSWTSHLKRTPALIFRKLPMAWNLVPAGGHPFGLNPLGHAFANQAAGQGFHNPADQMFLGLLAQQNPALTPHIAQLIGINGFNGMRMNVPKDQHRKHQRNIRDGKVTLGYHQTTRRAAEAIIKSQEFRPGSGGCVGAGMYFAQCPEETHPKTADHRGVILVADLRLGHRYKVDKTDPANFHRYQSCQDSLNFLFSQGCNSCKVKRDSGFEYVVYDPAQVSNIRLHSFCPGGGCVILDAGANEIVLGRDHTGTFSDFGGRNEFDRAQGRFQDSDRWQTCVRETHEESLGLLNVSRPPFTRGRDVVVHLPGFDAPVDRDAGYKCYLVSVPSSELEGFCSRLKKQVENAQRRGQKVEVSECVRFPVANVVDAATNHWRRGPRHKGSNSLMSKSVR